THGGINRGCEGAVAPAGEHAQVLGAEVRRGDIDLAVAGEVSEHNRYGVIARGKVRSGAEAAGAVEVGRHRRPKATAVREPGDVRPRETAVAVAQQHVGMGIVEVVAFVRRYAEVEPSVAVEVA